jgi:hypothetical protein
MARAVGSCGIGARWPRRAEPLRDGARDGRGLSRPRGPWPWRPRTKHRPDRLVCWHRGETGSTGFRSARPSVCEYGPFDLFRVFGALQRAPPPSGLFMADLDGSGPIAAQPRRLGTTLNTLGPVWRSEHRLLGFARRDDGTLALRSIDPTSGASHDLNVQLPAGIGRGAGLAARWDVVNGQALLLAHATTGAVARKSALRGPLQAWLVSFAQRSTAGASP